MIRYLHRLARNLLLQEDGPTAVEYAVMLALIILAAIGAVLVAGGSVAGTWSDINTDFGNAVN